MISSAEMVAGASPQQVRWQTVAPLDVEALAKARFETINLAQWLVRIANSYVDAGSADERVVLEFRSDEAAFFTKTFAGELSLELRLPTLELQFHESGKPVPHIFNPEERSPAEVEAWLLVELLHRGVDRTKFSKKLPYNIPGLMTGDAEDHSPQACERGLRQLMAWFRNAAAVLAAAAHSSGAGSSRIVCWSQTLTLSSAPNSGPTQAGFTPGDAQIAEPYFFRNRPSGNGSPAGKRRSTLKASELLTQTDPAAAAIAFMTSATG